MPPPGGGNVQLTRETIINDDHHAIKQIPQKLAAAAAYTLAAFVYNLFAPNGGSALTNATLQTAMITMRKQTYTTS